MRKSTFFRAVSVAISTVLLGSNVSSAQESISPWPPVTLDRHAPQNWPVPHPAPGVDLNTIPAGIVYNSLTRYERQAVQRSLNEVGLYAGRIDGVWGPATWNGTAAYAQQTGIRHFLDDMPGSLRVFQHITN